MRWIITGASSGIGLALVRLIAQKQPDAQMLLAGRDQGRLAEAADAAPRAAALVADLADPAAGGSIVGAAAEAMGGLDVVVSNAGAIFAGALAEIAPEDFRRGFDVNVFATLALAQAAYPHLKQSRGAFIATGSLAARNAAAGLGAYSSSKAALSMLMTQLAVEWGPDGIRCNSVSPGTVVTGINAHVYADADKVQTRASRIPLRRLGAPEEIAEVIWFLAQPQAAYVSGVDLLVDGGANANLMPLYLSGSRFDG